MANELTINVNLSLSKGNLRESVAPGALTYTVSGTKIVRAVQSIGTTDEALGLGEISSLGYLYIRNNDTTNYVEVGVDGTNYVVKLKAGEVALFRVDGAAVHAKANTAACSCEYLLIED